jgi:hypothetical protein
VQSAAPYVVYVPAESQPPRPSRRSWIALCAAAALIVVVALAATISGLNGSSSFDVNKAQVAACEALDHGLHGVMTTTSQTTESHNANGGTYAGCTIIDPHSNAATLQVFVGNGQSTYASVMSTDLPMGMARASTSMDPHSATVNLAFNTNTKNTIAGTKDATGYTTSVGPGQVTVHVDILTRRGTYLTFDMSTTTPANAERLVLQIAAPAVSSLAGSGD